LNLHPLCSSMDVFVGLDADSNSSADKNLSNVL